MIYLNNIGYIKQINDGIAIITNLNDVMQQELIEFPYNIFGMVMNIEEDNIGVIVFGDYELLKENDYAKKTNRVFEIPVGFDFLNRIIDPLGNPLDGKGNINIIEYRNIEQEAPRIIDRDFVNEPLETGIKVIDALVPIGKGQRELIIGDRKTGKTTIAIDTIINQKDKDVICIYVAIGQKDSSVNYIYNTLKDNDAMKNTVIINASASNSSSLLYIAPYSGVSLAEYFMYQNKDVLIIYDDLTKHANSYRELSLLLKRPPGREAYPGDIFYLHSRLLERSCKLKKELGGSITALPIIETQLGDISSYIPTNVISITDGQIFLQTNLFYQGVRPAINPGLSVSRVGGQAQIKAVKKVSSLLRLDLSTYKELESFSQFGSDVDYQTKLKLERGRRIVEVLKQDEHKPVEMVNLSVLLYALNKGYLDDIEIKEIKDFEKELYLYLKINGKGKNIINYIKENNNLPSDEVLIDFLKEVKMGF